MIQESTEQMQCRSDDFRAPRQQLVWAPGQGFTATSSSWRALAGPFSPPPPPPRSRGLRGPRYATEQMTKNVLLYAELEAINVICNAICSV